MFGYVTPLKGEMKVKDFERFKCYYCGLCCQIKKNFGNLPRLSLNYDMTFLGLLLDGISPEDIKVSKHKCILHPTQKKIVIYNNEALSYASYMNISLVYYKFIDDINDDNNTLSKLKSYMLWPYKRKFPKAIESINSKIAQCLSDLSKLETSKNFSSIDEISHPFSNLVGIILKGYPGKLIDDSDKLRNTLYNFGYTLGKWIYLIDALDDLKEDMIKQEVVRKNHILIK